MVRPRRITPVDLAADIKSTARSRLNKLGTAGLSLRAIARDLHITAPAIYNYYPRLEDLITALIVDAYTALGEALVAARNDVDAQDYPGQLRAVGTAYRQWAIQHPEEYNLIFGTPIPGYRAPLELILPIAGRGLALLVDLLASAHRSGKLKLDAKLLNGRPELVRRIGKWQSDTGIDAHPSLYYLALIVWTRVHGLVSLELYHQFPYAIQDPGGVFLLEQERVLADIGLRGG